MPSRFRRLPGVGFVVASLAPTRWRCRRCCSNIPTGLYGKHRRAIAAKSGEWSTGSSTSNGEEDRKARSPEAENKELRARIEAMEKKGEEEGRKMCGETMDVEDEEESRRKLDERRKKLQKELRDVERLSCISKEVQGKHQRVNAAPAARGGEKEA